MMAVLLFLPNLLLKQIQLTIYFGFYTVIIVILIGWAFVIVGKKKFITTLKIWGLGIVIYLFFAIPRIYLAGALTPYFNLVSITDRWLYSLLLPLLLLGTLMVGMIFCNITAPSEFLPWRYCGVKITLLMRALQHAIQICSETKVALMLQNKWPDTNSIFNLRNTWLIIRASPLLVSITLRNIILYWFPWGWLCWKKKINKIL